MNPATDLGPSIIRTVVPILVALIVGLGARAKIDLGPWSDVLSQMIGGVVAAVYYTLARWLETHVKPKFGWLLGAAKQPAGYVEPSVAPAKDEAGYAPNWLLILVAILVILAILWFLGVHVNVG